MGKNRLSDSYIGADFFITKELEKRRITISSIIPVFRSLMNKLRKSDDLMAQKIATGLDSRMADWDTKKL